MSLLSEAIIEDAALTWLGELGYAIGHGPHIAPGEPAAERDSFGEVVLVGRLRDAIQRLNPARLSYTQSRCWRWIISCCISPDIVGQPAIFPLSADFKRLKMLRDFDPRMRHALSRM